MTQKNCEIIPVNLGMVNAYLLKHAEGKAILIDCGVPGSDKAILQAMSDAGIQNKDLELIIVTHGHSDHMGASSALRDATGAKTMIHTLDADIIRTGKSPKLHGTNLIGKISGHLIGETVKDGTVFAAFTDFIPTFRNKRPHGSDECRIHVIHHDD